MTVERVHELPPPPARPDDAHKGTFGRVLIVAGSTGMSGAAALAGLGALRGGAGLVSVAVPESILSVVAGIEPSFLTIPLPADDQGRISSEAADRLHEISTGMDAMAIGPGLGQSTDLAALVSELYRSRELPLVVDADGLNLLAHDGAGLGNHTAPRILTPHPGEFARLTGRSVAEIAARREGLAAEFAAEHGVVLVLKGAGTVVTGGGRLSVNPTGNNGMATGGAGDVLTGLITALLGQGMSAFGAAQLGVYLHGLAGDLAAGQLSAPGLIASDLPLFLGAAWQRWLSS